jgi:hypothetical protein
MLSGIDLEGELMKVNCIEHECKKFVNVIGENPQTGEIVNEWDCADTWVPILMIENSKQQRGTSAAVESLRNEVANANSVINNMQPPKLMST